jgi:hypothetical protein
VQPGGGGNEVYYEAIKCSQPREFCFRVTILSCILSDLAPEHTARRPPAGGDALGNQPRSIVKDDTHRRPNSSCSPVSFITTSDC